MKNMFQMIKEAASMQKNVKRIQAQLREKTVEYSSGPGQVTATARGDGSIARISIDPSVIAPERASDLEKMVLKAVDGALDAAKKLGATEMKAFAAKMGLPDIPGM
jgi:nucleoid-associated protein EbfC